MLALATFSVHVPVRKIRQFLFHFFELLFPFWEKFPLITVKF